MSHLSSRIMLLYNCITVFSKLTLSHLLDPMAAQHLFAFESTRRHKSGLTDVKADRHKDTDQIKRNSESEKKKEGRDEKKRARFRLCDMSCFCQCQDCRHPLGLGDGSIHRQRWIIGYFE